MFIFCVLFIYLMFIAVFSYYQKDIQKRKLFQVLSSLFGLWLVLALRSPVCGVDLLQEDTGAKYYSYYSAFSDIQGRDLYDIIFGSWRLSTGMELGWLIYTKILVSFFPNFQFLLAVTAAIQLILIGQVFYKCSTHIVLSSIILFTFDVYLACFSTLRQTLALSITFYSFLYLLNKKYLKYALCVLLASTFHISALIFIVVWPLSYINLTFKKGVTCILLLLCLLPFLSEIVQIVTFLLFHGRFQNYQNQGGAITMFGVYIIIFLLLYMIKKKTRYTNLLRIMILLAVFGQSLGYISTGAMTRIGMYFSVFFTMAFPVLIDARIALKSQPVVIAIVSSLFFLFFYLTSKGGYLNVVPYHFFWETDLGL